MLRRTLVALTVVLVLTTLFSFTGCNALLGDFEVGSSSEAEGRAPGEACQEGGECASGACTDGICCETACDGICETCNLPGMVGKCMPVPDGEDPDNECPTTPLPDAGADDPEVHANDGGNDAGDSESDDAGDTEAGPTFSFPDGGITTTDNQCAGKCNGKRACYYPAEERTCGSVFCGNTTQQGRASCDGKGHCLFGVEECSAYACPDGSPGCKTTCTSESDCLATHFCDAQTSTCKPKLGNGSACLSVAQCQSGYCVDNVCCNDSCNGFPGASCTVPGSVGQCKCTACPSGGTCQLYYRDQDKDGFGDKYGTVVNGNAKPGCVDGPQVVGFVANKEDCSDERNDVRPSQKGWFSASYTHPINGLSFDYDCDDKIVKQTQEYPGSKGCGYCKGSLFSCSGERTTCTSTSQVSGVGCYRKFEGRGTRCVADTDPAFTTSIECGNYGYRYSCGPCSQPGAYPSQSSAYVQQRCH